jgi:N-acetylmuramoyl-L-alanine amidase
LVFTRFTGAAVAALLIALLSAPFTAQAPQSPAPYTVLSREGRRPLAARVINGQEMFSVDDLGALFKLTAREAAGGLTITAPGGSIVLTPGQDIASVSGRLISLPAPPSREGSSWFVPVDFVSRALAPVAGTRVELRKPSRLILVGDIRMPRVAGRLDPSGSMARLTFDVAPSTPHTLTQEGSRLLLRFEADALDASLPGSPVPDLVAAVRPDGAAGIAIDLGPRFATFRSSDAPGPAGSTRITIEVLAKTTEPPPGAPGTPPPGTPPPEPPPLLDLVPPGTIRTVVIDPGHGGPDEGSRGPSGGDEKEVTLSVARRLKAVLEARLGVRVILTRDADREVGLDERAAVANNNKADLFISLHANASVRPAASGAEVFYLSLQEYGVEAQRAATAPRESLPVFGGGTRDIEVVQWRFAQARHIQQSEALAKIVEGALRARVPMTPRSLQQAPFRVLVGANMPAVLVEMGFMTNPQQETQLASDAYQNDVVQALVEAVVQYRAGRRAPPAPPSGGAR